MHAIPSLLLALTLMLAPISAGAAPSDAARGLVRDLEKIIVLQQQGGWQVDEYEYRSMLPTAMNSICQVDEATRTEAEAMIENRLQKLGGSPEIQLKEGGVPLEELKDAMTIWRIKTLLKRGLADAKFCPFWMDSSKDFFGVHADEGRWSYSLEGGGLLITRKSAGDYRFGAGGGGRLTAAYGFSPEWDLRSGLGFGGGALGDSTVKTENVDVDFYINAPIIIRHTGVLWRQEIEVAPLSAGIPGVQTLRFGVRVGGLLGLSYLRLREIMPWAGLALYGEHLFARGHLPSAWTLRIGARFGFSWSPTGN